MQTSAPWSSWCIIHKEEKLSEVKALPELRGQEQGSGTETIKGFQTRHSVRCKPNSKENITIQISCLTVWRPELNRVFLLAKEATGNMGHLLGRRPGAQVGSAGRKVFVGEGGQGQPWGAQP